METAVDSRIERVELFEDRAAITRVLRLEAGRHKLVLGPVSPLVDSTRTTRVIQPGDADWVLEDARVVTVHRRQRDVDPETVKQWQAEHDTASVWVQACRDRVVRAQASSARLWESMKHAQQGTGAALQAGEAPEGWVEALEALETSAGHKARERAEAEHAVGVAQQELRRLAYRLQQARQGTSIDVAMLELQIHASTAGLARVRTVVPCGLWRPTHRAVLQPENTVHWEVRAACWNATGEDWNDVELVCSTARPGQHADPPALIDDHVHTVRRSTDIVVEAREEQVQVARTEGGTQVGSTLPGVDDGGEAREYTAPKRVTLPSDGRPVFVTLERFEAPCEVRWQAVPGLRAQAVLRSAQVNPTQRPLLAGPVELIRGDLAVGMAQVALVPAGERFQLGWGNHDGLRLVHRRQHQVESTLIAGTQTHTFTVEIRVSHLGTEPVTVQIDERIPVSELKQVKVTLVNSRPALARSPDEDGFCGWRPTLQPGEHQRFELVYTLVASKNIQLPF